MKSLFTPQGDRATLEAPNRKFIKIFPIFLILGLGGILLYFGWDRIFPPLTVDVVRARMAESTDHDESGIGLFQAAGWVKAEPYLNEIPALVSGYVKKIYAIDGQFVKNGDLLAELVDDDFKIAVKIAAAELEEIQAHLKNIALKVSRQDTEIELNEMERKTAEKIAETLKLKMNMFKQIGSEYLGSFEIEEAKLKYEEQIEKTKEYDVKKKLIFNNKEQLTHDLHGLQNKAKAAELLLSQKELDLSRTRITAPIDGIISNMYARVGRKQMAGSDNVNSTTVASLFDPKNLQVQVDVPFSDVAKVNVGQKCLIQLEAISKTINGEVSSIGGTADYQKNTLAVKVKILESHSIIRPEMLAQVEFQGSTKQESQPKIATKTMVFLKKEVLLQGSQVWVIKTNNRLSRITLELGKEERDGWVSIKSGLNAGTMVVLNSTGDLKEGMKIKIGKIHE